MDPNRELLHPRPLVEVVYAGGTISSLATESGHREGGHVVDLIGMLEEHQPGVQAKVELGEARVTYTGLSENIDEDVWQQIGVGVGDSLANNPHAVVVTHGTDSMEQTARYLDDRFKEELTEKNARVIITGANDDITAENTDAWDNLAFALESAASSVEPGVYIAFHGKLIPAVLAVKEPFNGVEMNFVSREDPEYQNALHEQEARRAEIIGGLESVYGKQQMPREDIVDYPVNVVRPDHRELLEYVGSHDVRAILLTLYHSGTANTKSATASVVELARQLREERGITLFGVTENSEEVNFGAYETGLELRDAGIVPLGSMEHDVALAKLNLQSQDAGTEALIQEMTTNRAGELV